MTLVIPVSLTLLTGQNEVLETKINGRTVASDSSPQWGMVHLSILRKKCATYGQNLCFKKMFKATN